MDGSPLPIRQKGELSQEIKSKPPVELVPYPTPKKEGEPKIAMADPDVKETMPVDDDPVVAEFPVFIKPGLGGDRKFFVLQFPNRERDKPYDAKHECAPIELRVKPNAGMVELDVPMDVHRNFDRVKGIKWGEAMNKSSMAKGGGSHGLPGGFGIGGSNVSAGRSRGRGEAEEAESQEKLLSNYQQAVEDGHVLQKQTLGGQFVAKNSTSPQYMVGTFTNGQLHLTPVDQIVPMRPQFHHIDALTEQERLTRARDAGAGRAPEARALHMTVKSAADGEDDHTTSMADRIKAVQNELWRLYRWVDADAPEAWNFFRENMFAGGAMGQDTKELLAKVPKLVSGITDEQYLDMISAPRDKARFAKAKKEKQARIERKLKKESGKGKEATVDEDYNSSSSWESYDDDDIVA